MPTARNNLAASVVNNSLGQPILYAIGGYDGILNTALRRVEAYNFATNTWSQKAGLPSGRAQSNGANVIGGRIYLAGGSSSTGATRSLYVYDPGTNKWTTKASMPVTNSSGVSGVINGKLYVLVGFCGSCSARYPRRLYRYDPSSNTWTRRADCPRQHVYGAAGVIDGKLYVVGGDDGNFDTQSAQGWLDVYNPVTNTWTAKASLPVPRVGGAATVLAKKLYVVGGNSGEASLAEVHAYDPATNTWAEKAPMRLARDGLAAGRVTYGGVSYILAVGGSLSNGAGVTGKLERYTP